MNILIAFVLVVAYVVTLCLTKREIPSSLSQSVFMLPRGKAWIWTLLVFAFILLTLIPIDPWGVSIASKARGDSVVLLWIGYFALAVVGVTPLIQGDKESMDYKAHMAGAYVSAVTLQLMIALNCSPWLLGWFPVLMADIIYYNRGKKWRTEAFWAEMTCFLLIIGFAIS